MFPKRLRYLRDSHNLSMDKLVELYNNRFNAKMNKSTLSRYENGTQDPIYTVVINLAKLFNVSVDYITCNDKTDIFYNEVKRDFSIIEHKILSNCQQLNDNGQQKVLDFSDDLISSNKYAAIGRERGYGVAAYGASETEEDYQPPIEEITT